jgi:hypothetical protein
MALPREVQNVFPEGFIRLLLPILQVSGVVGSHIRALEVAREDFFEILPTTDHVSWEVVQSALPRVG